MKTNHDKIGTKINRIFTQKLQRFFAAWDATIDSTMKHENDEWKDRYDASVLVHAATIADLRDCKLALAQELEISNKMALAVKIASSLPTHQGCAIENHAVVVAAMEALAAWEEYRKVR